MEFRQLNAFITVAKLSNFTKAAFELGYSQSAITAQIQQLEKELGVNLFERLGKNISLTSEGEQFLVYAKQIIKLCDEAKSNLSTSDVVKGTLTIGANESLCAVRLPPLVKEFHDRYPEIEILLKMEGNNKCKTLIRENQIDVAFIIGQKINDSDLITELEFPEPLVLLAIPGHPLAFKKHVYPEDIADYNIIVAEKGCGYRNLFERSLNDAGVTPKSIMEMGSIQSIKQLTMSGLGITLLPKIAAQEELKRKQLIELQWWEDSFYLTTQMVYHRDKWGSRALRAFIDLSKEMMKS
ncbi:LysR family transcriptional regulator [Clostridium beijerinckii]|uniref:LysR family transcriptional regulator n=2 Tax=Clostridium beijerinckii TaxID=1520 RepID=A0AAE2UYW3_CLOBE|nr:LysR family transcriptional regulator [Clostridium beijerinckii]ABR35308.1 transcriptional regulator, LysR family [Clostridium beijerinckii NCIMB 8052]AIU03592.1 LysR family transcriptional regulator [Clostridium beijerinckii ATCC 35702]MBF7810055.1 LysR family transcriptional regulator [Clostridium beijerinckii]NRT23288.1 DNA-binding transcriptional LysR family regulator [Clostridium beijerinckii]NRT69141.1 DNA-binding transcriptional LysR family regulator [Clostridium beijerinckii]